MSFYEKEGLLEVILSSPQNFLENDFVFNLFEGMMGPSGFHVPDFMQLREVSTKRSHSRLIDRLVSESQNKKQIPSALQLLIL